MYLTNEDKDNLHYAKFLLFRYSCMEYFPFLCARKSAFGTLRILWQVDKDYFKKRLEIAKEDSHIVPFKPTYLRRFYFQQFEDFIKFQQRQPLEIKLAAFSNSVEKKYPKLLK